VGSRTAAAGPATRRDRRIRSERMECLEALTKSSLRSVDYQKDGLGRPRVLKQNDELRRSQEGRYKVEGYARLHNFMNTLRG
jgi:hypothetical protein